MSMVHRAVAQHQGCGGARHEIRVEGGMEELIVSVDRGRMERVLSNLIGNAIKYSLQGGIVILEIREERTDDGRWAVIAVRDSGVGIPAADLPRVFELFHRGSNVAEQVKGSGIGLAGAKQIVEQHGGTIGVGSVEGVGTVATIRLPVVATARRRAGRSAL